MKLHYTRFISACLLFGLNGIVASHILLSSHEIVFWRTLIGSLFLLAVFVLTGGRFGGLRKKKHLAFLLLSGMAMGTSWMFLYEAYRRIGVGPATLAYYCGPVIVMVLAPVIFREKLAFSRILGFGAVLVGMVLVNGDEVGRGELSWGLACGLLSAVMLAVMVIFNKMAEGITGFENAVWQLSASFVTVAVFTVVRQGAVTAIPPGSLLPLLLLGFVNTGFGCYLYFSSMQRLPAQSVAICGYLEPFSALLFSAVLLGERLTPVQMAGAAMILGGAAFGEFFGRKGTPAEKQNGEPDTGS
ncbi:MAG: DMT family transporter [Synergistaceae bacterium]|jgi:drug/metabolite transporter (DMT)-like permease|nr:DMT family transporter [Synergistaceae bacterium]MDD3390089.1 DMT family transporter [Synergistaceae bacterium]MDD3689256.1 DMT family transporter [Synergistaceae bacterium]MDD4021481.1 DMT family transporter [Synergistaceae bacterium]MDD4611578.1 DMT family transporter [Synergistaceae bacterium]